MNQIVPVVGQRPLDQIDDRCKQEEHEGSILSSFRQVESQLPISVFRYPTRLFEARLGQRQVDDAC